MISGFEFAHPHVLWLLIPVIAGVAWRWFSTPAAIAVSSTSHYTNSTSSKYFTPRHLLLVLEALAAVLFIAALARPQKGLEVVPMTKEGTDIIIVLDFSNSMDAYDPDLSLSKPEVIDQIRAGLLKDRLGVAREQIARFVSRRQGDRIGLVIFGVDAFPAVPPTTDHDYLIEHVNILDNSVLASSERGTNIAGGIAAGINALIEHSENRRTMVLITDGDHTVDDAVFTPTSAAQAAKEKEIVIHTVGIGSEDPFVGARLERMGALIRFDTRNLERIASITGGRFFRAKDNKGFEETMDTIDALETTSRQIPAIVYQSDLYPGILKLGIATLIIAFLLRHTLLREIS